MHIQRSADFTMSEPQKSEFFLFLTNENVPFIPSNKGHRQKFPTKPKGVALPEENIHISRIFMCRNIWHEHTMQEKGGELR